MFFSMILSSIVTNIGKRLESRNGPGISVGGIIVRESSGEASNDGGGGGGR